MVSYIQVLRLKLSTHFLCSPYVLEATPISFFYFPTFNDSDVSTSISD